MYTLNYTSPTIPTHLIINNNNPFNIDNALINIFKNNVFQFEIVDKFRYLGFYLYNDMSFNKVCKDINFNTNALYYKSLLNCNLLDNNMKILIIKKYLYPLALHNAPIIGALALNTDKGLDIFDKVIQQQLTPLIRNIM
eukprot:UN08017